MSDAGPIIVIGAGRSGTNILRDVICGFDGFTTWPCDEINYIWRHGNRDAPTDELRPAHARPEVVRFIRKAFDRQRGRSEGGAVVEKTCANSVRVGFVHTILPEARYVYIVRDGRDVVASAMDRWTAPLDISYLAHKARFVPLTDLPYYATRYARSRLSRFGARDRRLSTWGPRFEGMNELVRNRSLAEVCGSQWMRCVESADKQFSDHVDASRVHRMHYESLVTQAPQEIERLAGFLGVTTPDLAQLPMINASSVGRWRATLGDKDQAALGTLLGATLAGQGYEP